MSVHIGSILRLYLPNYCIYINTHIECHRHEKGVFEIFWTSKYVLKIQKYHINYCGFPTYIPLVTFLNMLQIVVCNMSMTFDM